MSVDIFDKCKTDGGYFGKARAAGDRDLTRPTMDPIPGKTMKYRGEDYAMWSVNNYIGLAENQDVKARGSKSPGRVRNQCSHGFPYDERQYPASPGSGKKTGRVSSQKEAAYLFNFGYMGVLGIVSSLCGPKDTVVVDKLAHACILDAARYGESFGIHHPLLQAQQYG